MKYKFILLAFIFFSARAYSQSKNQISVLYGKITADVDIHSVLGDYGYNTQRGMVYGFMYTRTIRKFFSLEAGVMFAGDKIQLNEDLPGPYQGTHNGEAKMISVPVTAKFTFFKYLFADAGFALDKQTNYTSSSVVNDQSGLGGEMGAGAQFTFKKVTLFINPYVREYAITRFDNNLFESGVKFGLGYNF